MIYLSRCIEEEGLLIKMYRRRRFTYKNVKKKKIYL